MFSKELVFFRQRIKIFHERVKRELCSERINLHCEYAASEEPVKFEDRLQLAYRPITVGEKWGKNWESGWFHITGTVPKQFAGHELALMFNAGGESLIFDWDGTPIYGLTGNSWFAPNYTKTRYPLKGAAESGRKLEFWVESAANLLVGMLFDEDKTCRKEHPQGRFTGHLVTCALAIFNRELWNLHLDLEVLISMIEGLPEKDFRISRYVSIISEAADAYNETPANAAAARSILKQIFDIAPSGAMMTMHGEGHAHIDTGWLWPVRETIRKCARTFSSQIAMLEEYPEYIFGASAAQHYAFVKQYYPGLYKKIKEAVAGGRWEIQGGMWVEADCNLISGESMVRQFLHGKNFFLDEFGFDVKNVWIPDVFGYSAALPQIARQCGCDYFLTQKLSWNQYNQFPYHTFRWQGIDGSELLTHFPPEDTYNSMLDSHAAMEAQNNYKEADTLSDFMSLYGIGNGGGGPFPELVEHGKRMATLDGCPHFKFDRADRFFETINTQRAKLPVWQGELYFEMHRGTFTSQARTKRGNRKAEQILTLTEFICSMLPLDQYPSSELDYAWKLLLINQFHDIIPGSSIDLVYKNTETEHKEIIAACEKMIDNATAMVFQKQNDSAVIINSLSYDYTALVALPDSWDNYAVTDTRGTALPTQNENGQTYVRLFLPKTSVVEIRKSHKCSPVVSENVDELVLENDLVRYSFSPDARLLDALDKINGCSMLKPNEYGNILSVYVDNPVCWDAWDVDIYYSNQTPSHPQPLHAVRTVSGDLRSVLEFELKISDQSTIHQTVILETGSTRLDFKTRVDWHECHRMLRTAFYTGIFVDEASFDIQYGFVRRSMTNNSSKEIAQFEVCGQRYADISDDVHGIAVLNDCKYGHKVKNGVIDLALLRASTYPDSTADQGIQEFTYSLLPHRGNLINSDVMSQAALLNRPPLVIDGVSRRATPVCELESDVLSLEVIKKAEKEDCLIIRIVETKGLSGRGVLKFHKRNLCLIETDLLEWKNVHEYNIVDDRVELAMKPFEIKTFKIFSGEFCK